MHKIITTVGTSIFTNKSISNEIFDTYDDLRQKSSEKWSYCKKSIDYLERKLKGKLNSKNSAEIKSIELLRKKLGNESFDLHFISSDTILSLLAAKLLADHYSSDTNVNVFFDYKFDSLHPDVIKNLQVEDPEKFKKGMGNLIEHIEYICQGYFKNVILNITGGYKATIPYMTILGQVHNIPLYYVFENTNSLIEIPQIPIDINKKIFEKYSMYFHRLEDTKNEVNKSDLPFQFIEECGTLLDYTLGENAVMLNLLGELLWNKYKQNFKVFYCPDDVYSQINDSKSLKRILSERLENIDYSYNKVQKKKDHWVYDDGNNCNRIYFFIQKNKKYIYKVFDSDHDSSLRYIDTKFGSSEQENVIGTSKLRKFIINQEEHYV